MAGGGMFNGSAAFGTQFFTTAANQYAILTLYPGSGGQLAVNVGAYVTDVPTPSSQPYEIHVAPNAIVEAETAGTYSYVLSWVIYQST